MISYLGSDESDKFAKALMSEPMGFINNILPLKYKFLNESYILLDKKEILGLITVAPTVGNHYKISITRLVFQNNFYDAGKQLIEFVISKYGAKGATSFSVAIDECHDELLRLFTEGCGFRQCSSETLWKTDNFDKNAVTSSGFRAFDNTDAKSVCRLYNSEIEGIYRPSLERIKQEFYEPILGGYSQFYKNRYVLEEPIKKRIVAYMSLTTSDNLNFIIDLTTNNGYQLSYDDILGYAISEIYRRRNVFYPLVKQKKYTKTSDKLEEYLKSKNYHPIQTQIILVKNFYRPLKTAENALHIFMFGENSQIATNMQIKANAIAAFFSVARNDN